VAAIHHPEFVKCVWTTCKEYMYLVVFIITQNMVGINAELFDDMQVSIFLEFDLKVLTDGSDL